MVRCTLIPQSRTMNQPTTPRATPKPAAPSRPDVDARSWNPAAADFAKGVEVTEVVGTLPDDLLELFQSAQLPAPR